MKLGIIGIGLMGQAFAQRFLAQGHPLSVFNRSRNKLEDLEAEGAQICNSVNELISRSDIIILMLSDAIAIEDLLPISANAAEQPLAGKTVVQMATISPQQSRHFEENLLRAGASYLEAPVLGSISEALSGNLIIMAGGDSAVFESTRPVLKILGPEPRLIGTVGSASALKLAMNQLIAALTAGFSLSLGYAQQNGVDSDLFMDVVRDSALYAKTYDKKLQKYLSRDFGQANFSTRHLLKDIRLFIEDAQACGLNTAALEGIERITAMTVDSGLELADYSSIYQSINPPASE